MDHQLLPACVRGALGFEYRGKRTNGILAAESELQPIDLALVYGVLIENLYVEEPFFEIVGRDQGDAWGQAAVYLDAPESIAEPRGLG